MKFPSITIATAVAALGVATCFAQAPSPPASTTNPSNASSPSQRDSTRLPAAETPAESQSKPSDATTPHQRQAMASKPHTMKECMDMQAAKNPDMSRSDMTKACNDQMKMHKDSATKSKSSTTDDSHESSPK